jgi:hypothetical protein
MEAAELQHDWFVHQRTMASELPRLVANARTAANETTELSVWRPRLTAALAVIGAALHAHVATAEQTEGFLPSSAREAPRLIHALEQLQSEHRALIGDVARAEVRARSGDSRPATIRAVNALADRIERHLQTADRVAMEITNTDLGYGD